MLLEKGPYLGDVTALCLASLPSGSGVLIAATGAQVDCYNLENGARIFPSVHVFDGIRVHGVVATSVESTALSPTIVAVHGEGKVKLLRLGSDNLELWQSIPRFSKWILDVRILRKADPLDVVLAIGLSDNSVCLWSTLARKIVFQFHCPEKCLLYSLRLYGDSVGTLQIAAGTIYNEVLVWILEECSDDNRGIYNAKVVHRLCGHEGSIYRITWSEDGGCLGSVSDDRSARIWNLDLNTVTVLFGHTARVWDLHIDEKMLITASEDCTCGVWSVNGELLRTLKGHIGRGIWRCIFVRRLSILITAGADAAIKVYTLSDNDLAPSTVQEMVAYRIGTDISTNYLDSKSEYVRCLSFEGPSSLYITTNHGLLKHVFLLSSGSVKQDLLMQTPEQSPLVCLDVFKEREESEVWVSLACGDGQGRATVLRVTFKGHISSQSTWTSEPERQLLGVFWCKSLDSRFVFTTDPKGGVRCWDVDTDEPRQLAQFKSSLSSRIVCMDATLDKQVLVCGDQKGNLLFFNFSSDLFQMENPAAFKELDSFRDAHGISAVSNVSVLETASQGLTIVSTGRDGCACELFYQSGCLPDVPSVLSCGRVEKTSAITVLESVLCLSTSRRIGLGFAAADFVLWDITNEVELKRISCGGWKRPHSFFVGEQPESQFCFAFVKEHTIWIYRTWNDGGGLNDVFPLQALQKQSHGREIHSVLFFSSPRSGSNWLLSGSEDGRVQVSKYVKEELTVFTSLEEHVGGSAVRALALSIRVYNAKTEASDLQYAVLFSAGAKEVITCWELKLDVPEQLSARWLSTHSTFGPKAAIKDDLRYMAMTVFATESDAGSPVYFVVAALSNAILCVKTFEFSSKTWSSLAYLRHHKSPVLSLHQAVTPCFSSGTSSNRFFVFSGSTDGSIAVWDLTNIVTSFASVSRPQDQSHSGLRPLSGRGSQGGKAFRRLNHQRHPSQTCEDPKPFFDHQRHQTILQPLCVLHDCHQSGVNSLYVCTVSTSTVSIVSGGDDQALHLSVLSFKEGPVQILSRENVPNAHDSAVKGVWSDGEWIFSTGLDQRVRSWQISKYGQLKESASCIIDVPETESIDARRFGKGYIIAAVGRGLQVVNFTPKSDG